MRLDLTEPEQPLFYPSLALASVDFRVTDDLLDSRVRGRLGQSSIGSGTVRVHSVEGGETTLSSRESLDLERAHDLYLDSIYHTEHGLRVSLRGIASSLRLDRQGAVAQLVPTWLELTYRTEGGRLVVTLLFALAVVLIEFALARPRAKTPNAGLQG